MGEVGLYTLRLIKAVFLCGIVIGLFGLFFDLPSNSPQTSKLAKVFQLAPVEANSTSPESLNESAAIPLLNAWPEIDDLQPAETIPPVETKTTAKKPTERSLRSKIKKAPTAKHTQAQSQPVSAVEVQPAPPTTLTSIPLPVVQQTVAATILSPEPQAPSPVTSLPETDHDPAEETLVESLAVTEEDEVAGPTEEEFYDEETPVYTEEEVLAEESAVIESSPREEVPATPEAQSPPSESRLRKRGYMVRVEGNDLVVVDSQGKELFRKSQEKAHISSTPLSRIQDAAKRLEQEVGRGTPQPEIVAPESFPTELKFHIVQKGENPSKIAKLYPGLSAQKLMEVNGIKDPSGIQIGTKLWIPDTQDGLTHVVQAGETLTDLLTMYKNLDLNLLCDTNGLPRTTNTVPEGTTLVIPGPVVAKPVVAAKKKPNAITIDPSLFKGKGNWTWPVIGEVALSSPYGLRIDPFALLRQKAALAAGGGKKGLKRSFHHGIDLSMPVGTPVRAARDGEVIKVSESRWGHGKMVQVLHDDGWSTVYSHNSRILVSAGDRVKQGDIVALSGNTGRSTGPHLHFEIRRPDQRSVDPRLFLEEVE
jgi:murein DD-endopeptidase MepM/ murein hydrolase activator NlpD